MTAKINNPFRPGAGHRPPYLAGRVEEKNEFKKIIKQEIILNNLILTGLRGVGKTVLLEEFRTIAINEGWQWVGTDCSESASVTEESIALRILTDLALITSNVIIKEETRTGIGFSADEYTERQRMDFQFLVGLYDSVPGFPIDKLKHVLMFVWDILKDTPNFNGMIFAYDEAQTLSDHSESQQYPFSLLLDLFQYLQRNGVRFVLILTGLPTLLTKLIETRTYTERLFRVLVLDRLSESESRDAILRPIQSASYFSNFTPQVINEVIEQSGGYPYFIQFICRELCDSFIQGHPLSSEKTGSIPMDAIIQKLDNDFFAGRWSRATEREQQLMIIMAESGNAAFTISEVADSSTKSKYNKFSNSLVNQCFSRLIEKGLIYKDRRGVYRFAVPLLSQYILRTLKLVGIK